MSSDKAKIHPLFAVPDTDAAPEEATAQGEPLLTEQPNVCQFCFGSGMEVVAGKGARRCRCRTQHNQEKLLMLAAKLLPRQRQRHATARLQLRFPSGT